MNEKRRRQTETETLKPETVTEVAAEPVTEVAAVAPAEEFSREQLAELFLAYEQLTRELESVDAIHRQRSEVVQRIMVTARGLGLKGKSLKRGDVTLTHTTRAQTDGTTLHYFRTSRDAEFQA